MNNSNWNITKAAERLKKLYKEHGLNQSDLAQLLGYAPENRTNVSKAMNARAFLLQEQYELLAAKWNVRFEYLVGIDNYKTPDDYYNSRKNKALSEYRQIIAYLEYLGLTLKPAYYLATSIKEFRYIADDNFTTCERLSAYFSEDVKKHIKQLISSNDMSVNENDMTHYVELTDNPNGALLKLDDITNFDIAEKLYDENLYNTAMFVSDVFDNNSDDDTCHIDGLICLQYKLFYNNKLVGNWDLLGMQGFFNYMNKMCQASIQSLLLDHDLEHSFIY